MKINDTEVFRKKKLSTSLVLGLADTFKTEVEKGKASVEVKIPTKNLEGTIQLDISDEVYLGISIVNRFVDFRISGKPFAYL